MSKRHLCLTCNQPLPGANVPCPNCAGSGSWPALDGLILAQSAATSYWYLARRDHPHLVALMDSWPAEDNPLRNLLARKLHRGIVVDGEHFLRDIVTLGARIRFRLRDETGHGVLTCPGQGARLPGEVSVATKLGALLLGMIEGRKLRSHGSGEAPFSLVIDEVHAPESVQEPRRLSLMS